MVQNTSLKKRSKSKYKKRKAYSLVHRNRSFKKYRTKRSKSLVSRNHSVPIKLKKLQQFRQQKKEKLLLDQRKMESWLMSRFFEEKMSHSMSGYTEQYLSDYIDMQYKLQLLNSKYLVYVYVKTDIKKGHEEKLNLTHFGFDFIRTPSQIANQGNVMLIMEYWMEIRANKYMFELNNVIYPGEVSNEETKIRRLSSTLGRIDEIIQKRYENMDRDMRNIQIENDEFVI